MSSSNKNNNINNKTCKYPGCSRPCYVEGNRVHDFCGRTHAQQYKALQYPTQQNQPNIQHIPQLNLSSQSNQWYSHKICKLPGCTKPCYIEGTYVHDFCGKSHAKQYRSMYTSNQPHLELLSSTHPKYQDVQDQFLKKWLKGAKPTVVAIIRVHHTSDIEQRYKNYRNQVENRLHCTNQGRAPGNERRRFHGTSMKCDLLGINGVTNPCSHQDCAVCGILRYSFKLSKSGTHISFLRFGRGIYFSSTSSKANDYNQGSERIYNGNRYRVVLLCHVVLGNVYKLTKDQSFTAPPPGYDSVVGEPGVALNFDECVVYDEAACKVGYIIIYKMN